MLEVVGTLFRAAVTFPPQVLGRVTEVWVNTRNRSGEWCSVTMREVLRGRRLALAA